MLLDLFNRVFYSKTPEKHNARFFETSKTAQYTQARYNQKK